MHILEKILVDSGAADAKLIRFEDCRIINNRLLDRISFIPQSVCVAVLPYYTPHCDTEDSTISCYAIPYDYHLYVKEIESKIIESAKRSFPEYDFALFCDHSPIDERHAAAKAGLGIIGLHGLLITPQHSSFVFIFELLTDLKTDTDTNEIKYCEKCSACIRACPGNLTNSRNCVSAITQMKGNLSNQEIESVKSAKSAWGCDICQKACPHTVSAVNSGSIYTNIDWFYNNINTRPTAESIANTDDFKKRAYSWRGKDTILRNIEILEKE